MVFLGVLFLLFYLYWMVHNGVAERKMACDTSSRLDLNQGGWMCMPGALDNPRVTQVWMILCYCVLLLVIGIICYRFQTIPRIFTRYSVKEAKKLCNVPKNRYVDILPCESESVQQHMTPTFTRCVMCVFIPH